MKISIITVCLNSKESIEQTIQSVISQKDESVEYIIIDGNSTDGTLKIIEQYKEAIDILVSEPDEGIYDAMNKGISLATGEVIGIINSDDWYEQGALDNVRKCFQKYNADLVYGKLNLIDEKKEAELFIPSDINKLRYIMEIPHPTVFIKKSIYNEFGGFSTKYNIASDYELMLRLYVHGVKFVFLNEVVANFRLGGISHQNAQRCVYETASIAKNYLPYYSSSERENIESIINHNFRTFCFRQLLNIFPDALFDYIERRCKERQKKAVSIFGAGKWGMEMYRLLSSAGMVPSFFIDNNKELWDRAADEIKVYPANSLKSFDGILLILVKGFSKEILQQVEEMAHPALVCITWEELADELKDNVFPG